MPAKKLLSPPFYTNLKVGDRVTVYKTMENHIAKYTKSLGKVEYFTKKKIQVRLDDGRLAAVFPDNVQKVSEG